MNTADYLKSGFRAAPSSVCDHHEGERYFVNPGFKTSVFIPPGLSTRKIGFTVLAITWLNLNNITYNSQLFYTLEFWKNGFLSFKIPLAMSASGGGPDAFQSGVSIDGGNSVLFSGNRQQMQVLPPSQQVGFTHTYFLQDTGAFYAGNGASDFYRRMVPVRGILNAGIYRNDAFGGSVLGAVQHLIARYFEITFDGDEIRFTFDRYFGQTGGYSDFNGPLALGVFSYSILSYQGAQQSVFSQAFE